MIEAHHILPCFNFLCSRVRRLAAPLFQTSLRRPQDTPQIHFLPKVLDIFQRRNGDYLITHCIHYSNSNSVFFAITRTHRNVKRCSALIRLLDSREPLHRWECGVIAGAREDLSQTFPARGHAEIRQDRRSYIYAEGLSGAASGIQHLGLRNHVRTDQYGGFTRAKHEAKQPNNSISFS